MMGKFFVQNLPFCHLLNFYVDIQLVMGCRCMVTSSLSVTGNYVIINHNPQSSEWQVGLELFVLLLGTYCSAYWNELELADY